MPEVRVGRVNTSALAGDRIMVYFKDGSSKRYIANNDITSSEVAVIGDRAFTSDIVSQVESDREIFKSKTTPLEEDNVEAWAYLFNLYDHNDTSIPFTKPTWIIDLMDSCIRPMGDGGGVYQSKADAYASLPEVEHKPSGEMRQVIPFEKYGFTFRAALSGFFPDLNIGFPDPPRTYSLYDGYFGGQETAGSRGQFLPRPYALARRSEHDIAANYSNADEIGNPTSAYAGSYPDPEDSTVGDILFVPRYESIRSYWFQECWGEEEELNPTIEPTVLFTIRSVVPDEPQYKTTTGQDVEYFYEGDEALRLRPGESGLNSFSDYNIVAWGYLSASAAANDDRTYAIRTIHCDIKVDIGYNGILDYDSNLYAYDARYGSSAHKGMSFHKNFTTGVESVDLGDFMTLDIGQGQRLLDELKLATQEFYDSFIAQFNWDMPAFAVRGQGNVADFDTVNNPDLIDPADFADPDVDENIPYNLNILLERANGDRKRIVMFVPDDYIYNADNPDDIRILSEPFYIGNSYVYPNDQPRPKGKRSLYVQVGDNQPRLLKEIPKTEHYDSHISPLEGGEEIEVVILTGARGDYTRSPLSNETGVFTNNFKNSRRPKYAWAYPDAQHVVPYHQLTTRPWEILDIYRINRSGAITSQETFNYFDPPGFNDIAGITAVSQNNWQWQYISNWQNSRPDLHTGRALNAIDTNSLVQFNKTREVRDLPSAYQGNYGGQIAYQRCVRYKDDPSHYADRGLFNCTRYLIDLGTWIQTANEFIYINKNDISHVDDNLYVTLNLYRFHQGIDKPNWDSSIFKALIDGRIKNSVYYKVTGEHAGGSIFVGGTSTFEASYEFPATFPLLQIPEGASYYDGAVDAIAYIPATE